MVCVYVYLEATSHGQVVELCVSECLALTLHRTHCRHPLLNLPQLKKLIEAQNLCSLPYVIQIEFKDVVAGEHVEVEFDDYEIPPREQKLLLGGVMLNDNTFHLVLGEKVSGQMA